MRLWIVAALLCSAALAQAQAQTPARKELAARLVQLQQQGIGNVGRTLAAQTAQRMMQASAQGLARMPADRREAVAKDVQAEVQKFYEDVEPMLRELAGKLAPATLVPLYEQRFTDDELKRVIAWLESPVSRKFQEVDAEVAKVVAEKLLADARPALESRLKTLEASLNRRMAAAAEAASAPSPVKK